jgi:hypothetical protein
MFILLKNLGGEKISHSPFNVYLGQCYCFFRTTKVAVYLMVNWVQGMCDLVAPLLVVLDDEAVVFACFRTLMKRMIW